MIFYFLCAYNQEEYIKEIYEVPSTKSDFEIERAIIDFENSSKINNNKQQDLNYRNTEFGANETKKTGKRSQNNNYAEDAAFDKAKEINKGSQKYLNISEIRFPADENSDFKDLSGLNKGNSSNGKIKNSDNSLNDKNGIVQQQKLETPSIVKDEKCYIAIVSNLNEKTKQIFANYTITDYFSTHFQGVAFCTNKPVDTTRSNQSVLFLEEDVYYYTSAIQMNVPNHMFFMMNYRNYIFNNTLFDSTLMYFLPIKYIYKFFYSYYSYRYTGKGVEIYIIDTAVDEGFDDFRGRVLNICKNGKCGRSNDDDANCTETRSNTCLKHGTNVADLIIGHINGFAKDAKIKVLNVFDCDGRARLSSILSALEIITADEKTVVLNMSINGPRSEIFNFVLSKLPKNIIVVTAAGNNSDMSCNFSPGSSKDVINVGSLNIHSRISKFSNYGGCVRLYSLGERITINKEIKGTSYSAALVSGSIAIYLESNPYAKSADVWRFLAENSDLAHGSYMVQKIPKFPVNHVLSMTLRGDCELWWGIFIILAYLTLIPIVIFIIWYVLKQRRTRRLRI